MSAENNTFSKRWELKDAMFSVENMYKQVEKRAKSMDMEQTIKALALMKKYHEGQTRKGKEHIPYIIHPLMMACHAFALGIANDVIIPVCLLHDVIEDCNVTLDELGMNEEVAEAINLVTFKETEGLTHQESKAIYFKKISENKTASIVKLLDRCNNVSTMATGFSKERIASYIDETEKYVIPLLDMVKHEYNEYYDTAYLIKYQMLSVIETLKRTL